MSWPFGFPFPPNDLLNAFAQFNSSIFQPRFGGNNMLSQLSPSLHYSANLALFSSLINQIEAKKTKQKILTFNLNQYENNQSLLSKQKQKISQKKQISSGQIRMVRFRRRRTSNRPKNLISHNSSLRNDTKNIPKNYGKAMLTYIQKNTRQVKILLQKYQVDHMQFMMVVKSFKSKINTIHDLREMWGQNQKKNSIKTCIRILSYHFMRKKCLPYIFNSRIKNYHTHIKYRKNIMEGIQNPDNFTKIKQF